MRATKAVQAMLDLLPAQPVSGWTEALVEAGLHSQGLKVNRVTVYRALNRLVEACVLQRAVDAGRITRYFLASSGQPQAVPQLECSACHQHFKLGENSAAVQSALRALRQALSQSTGVVNPQLDISVQGECAQCADPAAPSL